MTDHASDTSPPPAGASPGSGVGAHRADSHRADSHSADAHRADSRSLLVDTVDNHSVNNRSATGHHAASHHAAGHSAAGHSAGAPGTAADGPNPWFALWALVIGFFMILIDSTIVSVAFDSIRTGLNTDFNSVVWVTSAYLVAYVVPLLVSGRLGDQFGPKNVYLIGLAVFTIASALCGFSGSIEMLIGARVLQGIGAALMTPQTMAVITRTFAPANRGTAMSLWGSVAGIAILVGPLAGGVLVDTAGWEWIFFVNVPVGIVAFVLAVKLVPQLPTNRHKFDYIGIALSAVGLLLVVFGIQEGQKYDWGTISGPISVWSLIIVGVLVLVAFVLWQARTRGEALISLSLFKDRNFSLANIGITTMGFAITGMAIPLMLFAQKSMGLSPTRAALLLIPLAVMSGALARPVGKLTDRVHPRYLAGTGFLLTIIAFVWLGSVASSTTPVIGILAPIALMGIGNALIWAPLSATATRNLPMSQAGAGAGVYNMTRQVGAVLGSAAVGVLMQNRIAAELSSATGGTAQSGNVLQSKPGPLPAMLQDPFATAMGQAIYLPAAVLVIGFIAVIFFAKPTHRGMPASAASKADPAAEPQRAKQVAAVTD